MAKAASRSARRMNSGTAYGSARTISATSCFLSYSIPGLGKPFGETSTSQDTRSGYAAANPARSARPSSY